VVCHHTHPGPLQDRRRRRSSDWTRLKTRLQTLRWVLRWCPCTEPWLRLRCGKQQGRRHGLTQWYYSQQQSLRRLTLGLLRSGSLLPPQKHNSAPALHHLEMEGRQAAAPGQDF